jgi:hypothetical protein
VGAIALDPDDGVIINHEPNEYFVDTAGVLSDAEITQALSKFGKIRRDGRFLDESDQILETVDALLQGATSQLGPQFPNHLSRNLLMAIGLRTAMRRRGDVNLRMDLVFSSPGGERGVAEVEFSGQSLLDSPRNVLDNVAVLSNRYKVPRTEIASLIISLGLPNARAEYWRVIKDISTVLGLSIGSLTVQALILLVWNRVNLAIPPKNPFYADEDQSSIRAAAEGAIGRKLELSEGLCSVLEVAK